MVRYSSKKNNCMHNFGFQLVSLLISTEYLSIKHYFIKCDVNVFNKQNQVFIVKVLFIVVFLYF